MKRVAITGAGGFIGRRIAQSALAAGWEVRALTRTPEKLPTALSPTRWDMEGEAPPDLLAGVDAVIHGAAYRPDDLEDSREAEKCLRINATGTQALLEAARRAGVRRFAYLSAGNAYNSTQSPIPETMQLFPVRRASYYLASKLMGEIYVAASDQKDQISGCILRISSVYGPGMDERGLIAATARKLSAGQIVSLRNGGTFGADMVYVDDVAHAAVTALAATFRGAVNIGSGAFSTARSIAQTLADILGAAESQIHLEPQTVAEPGFGALDISLARKELGYVPTSLREGLARTWASMQEQRA